MLSLFVGLFLSLSGTEKRGAVLHRSPPQVFSPQKGATSTEDRALLEQGMVVVERLVEELTEGKVRLGTVAGSGAAGGMCGGFFALCPRSQVAEVRA